MTDNAPNKTCSHCHSTEILLGVKSGQSAEVGRIGLQYKDGLLLVGTEPLLADICTACGHIERLYVKNASHKWLT